MLGKCGRDKVPMTVILETEKCKEGVQMKWETFIVN
jgi:hypothetical protein